MTTIPTRSEVLLKVLRKLTSLRNLSLRGAVMNVVLGERMQEVICAQGVARTSTVVIHNWADGDLIKPVPRAVNACGWAPE